MSFSMGMLLVLPGEEDLFAGRRRDGAVRYEKRTIWRIEHTINLSTFVRLREGETIATMLPKTRARFYFYDAIWANLCRYINSDSREFAPAFTTISVGFKDVYQLARTRPTVGQWDERFAKHPRRAPMFVRPLEGTTMLDQIPSQGAMEGHNAGLRRTRSIKSLRDLLDDSAPFIWIDCEQVARWIVEWRNSSLYAQDMTRDHEASPYFQIWETYFSELGKLGGKSIFLMGIPAMFSFRD